MYRELQMVRARKRRNVGNLKITIIILFNNIFSNHYFGRVVGHRYMFSKVL